MSADIVRLQAITQEIVDLAKKAISAGPTPLLPLAKDATTTGYLVGTGLQGYSLEAPAKSLYPVVTPLRNRTPRVGANIGSLAAHWRAITGVNVGKANPFIAWGTAGAQIQVSEVDKTAAYKPLALGNVVQMDAQTMARGFDDLRARASVDTLYSLMIEEERVLIGGSATALATPGTITITTSTTGGSIGAVNVGVKVAVRNVEGLTYSGVGISNSSAEATSGLLSGTTNKLTVTVPAVRGAVQYDWYAGAAGGPWYFSQSTDVNTAVITSVPGSGTQAPTSDTSADANAFDGLLQQIADSTSGAYYKSLDGATLTGANGTIAEIDAMLLDLYQNKLISPTFMIMSPTQAFDLTNKVISTGGARMVIPLTDTGPRQEIVAGYVVAKYMNKSAGGQLIDILVAPYWPTGRIAAVAERLPYPNTNITNVWEIETQMEYTLIEYAMSRGAGATGGPRYEFEDRAIEVPKLYSPATCGLIDNILKG